MPKVIINSGDRGAVTPLHVNGREVARVPHGVETELSDQAYAVLADSSVKFDLVGATSPAGAIGSEGGLSGPMDPNNPLRSKEDREATEESQHLAAKEESPVVDELADVELGVNGGQRAELQRMNAEKVAEETEGTADGSASANEATGPAGSDGGKVNGLAVDPFDAEKTLENTIAKISEDLDEFTIEQLGTLITAEQGHDHPRVTLIEALERKRDAMVAEDAA